MQIKKLLATGLAALMAGSTLAMPALAATQLKDFPTFLGKDGQLDAFIVVGASAATADVVGAVDLAVRLAETSYTTVTTTGVAAVTGLDRDGIRIGGLAGGRALNAPGAVYTNPFPGLEVKNIHFSGLKDDVIKYRSNDYDFREQVDVTGIKIRTDFGTSNINGTAKMEVESTDIAYEYVFEKLITGLGDTTTKNYTYPVKVQLMGKEFTIVGTGTSSIVMLVGASGTATSTTPLVYGDYSFYAITGVNNDWALIRVKDKDGNTVAEDVADIQDGAKTFTAVNLDVRATDVRALQDGTVQLANLVVGPVGSTEKEYDGSADVTSTGTANDAFPGASDWGIQVSGMGTAGTIPANAQISVVYKPSSTKYLVAGEKVSLPNNYGELTFQGFGTDKLATITVEPENSGVSVYNYSADTQSLGAMKGIKISTDVPGTILTTAGNTFDEAYVLFNSSLASQPNTPVMIGFKDKAKQKILVNGTFVNAASETNYVNPNEYTSMNLNSSQSNTLRYNFKLSYGGAGERDYYLNVTVNPNTGVMISDMVVGPSGSATVDLGFQNKTAISTSQAPEFRLGATTSSSEAIEVNATTDGTAYSVGKASQTVVDDGGIQILNADSNGASDRVKILVPSKELTVRVTFGKSGEAAATAGTVNKIKSVTSAVAVLDTEVGATEKAKHLVLVGGPCANSLVQELVDSGKLAGDKSADYTCAGKIPGPAWTENTAYIIAVDNAFATGKVALVVAGNKAPDTRFAASVLQQSAASLKGSASKLSGGTITAPVVSEVV